MIIKDFVTAAERLNFKAISWWTRRKLNNKKNIQSSLGSQGWNITYVTIKETSKKEEC